MNRKQLTEAREHACLQNHEHGRDAAIAALKPLLLTIAKEISLTTSTGVDRDRFDDERSKAQVVAAWRNARAEWIASGRQGPTPRQQVLEQLVDADQQSPGDEQDQSIVDEHELLGTTVRNVLRSTAIAVFRCDDEADTLDEIVVGHVNDLLYDERIASLLRALHGKRTEFIYVPNWDGESVDTMIYELGLRPKHWNNSLSVDQLQPSPALDKFLRWINISTDDLIAAARATRPEDAEALIANLGAFSVGRDASRRSLVSPDDAISMLENAGNQCVPMYQCEIDLGELLSLDPNDPMEMSTAKGKIHIGLHDVVNGSGYMDTYSGTLTIPADHLGFGWVGRWSYGVDAVYGLVKSAVAVVPKKATSALEVETV